MPSARIAAVPPTLEARFLPPAGMQTAAFECEGMSLRYARWRASAAATLRLIVLPGFSEHLEKYFETIRELREHPYDIWVLDWRGQGGSDRSLADAEKGHAHDFADYVADLAGFCKQVLGGESDLPTVLVGHSMGGHLALRFLQEHAGIARAAVLAAPALWLGPDRIGLRAVAPAYAKTMSALGAHQRFGPAGSAWSEERDSPLALTHDPVRGAVQKQWFAGNSFLRIGGPTFGWYDAFFRSARLIAKPARLLATRIPLLVGLPTDDRVVSATATRRLCSSLSRCRVVEFPGAWHELFMETQLIRSRWMQELLAFLHDVELEITSAG